MLGEVSDNICFAGKGVDINNQIQPVQMLRGYAGVAILWKQDLDSSVASLPDSGERLQCIEFIVGTGEKILLFSAYLPSSSSKDSISEYHETVDQLYEILQKYQHSHSLIIGGDLIEDLSNTSQIDKRKRYLLNFINEFELKFSSDGKTFINSAGQECSDTDYSLYQSHSDFNMSEKPLFRNV